MKGRAGASPDRAGVSWGSGETATHGRSVPAAAACRHGIAAAPLAGLALVMRCALALAQPTPVPQQPAPAPEQPVPAPQQTAPAPEQPVPAPEQPGPVPQQAAP